MPPQNNGVKFDSDNSGEFTRPASSGGKFDLTGMIVSWGIVSTRKQAEYLEIGIAALAFIVIFAIWFY